MAQVRGRGARSRARSRADVEFSAEDACRTEYALPARGAAGGRIEAGATTLNIPDTVGYALPDEFGALIARLVARRARRDRDLRATATTTSASPSPTPSPAVAAGARQVEVHDQRHRRARRQHLARGGRDGAAGAPRRASASTTGDRHRAAHAAPASCSPRPPASGRSRTRRSSAATPSRTRRASTRTACSSNPLDLRDHDARRASALGAARLVLGKHSGRHAVAVAARARSAVALDAERARGADRARSRSSPTARSSSTTPTSLALVAHDARAPRRALDALPGGLRATQVLPTATVRAARSTAQRRSASAVGNGPLDAALKAIDAALGQRASSCSRCTRAR